MEEPPEKPGEPAASPPPPPTVEPPPDGVPQSPPSTVETLDEGGSDSKKQSLMPPQDDSRRKSSDRRGTAMKDDEVRVSQEDLPQVPLSREPSAERNKYPTNKALDFQVRVRVIEGRNLSGSNISPIVKVTVQNQARQTRVKKSTNKPFFDEIFFFNFKTIASELFDQMITFEAFNSRKLRSNAMIGNFSSDVGFFYDQEDHSVIRRWLLLTDPEDKMSGSKGYLKVTIMVLGPGDEAPEVPDTPSQEDDDDLEENLLQPAGVMLRPAVFSLKVYRLEDIPQMDSGFTDSLKRVFNVGEKAKALVDPYFSMTFAGKQSKTRYYVNDDNPEINQELSVKFQMPSMCERLKLQIWDWDKISGDDLVGTVYLPLNTISGQGEKELGYLPTYGPSFVNFYGSTREYSNLPDECDALNEGIGEGVAYRGRALVELETKVTGEMETGVEDIEDEDIIMLQSCLRRRKFKLFGCFLEATMIACKDIPVQFEMSIGNYGNRLDQSVAPSSSSTPSSNAVYDGCYYYYLPWGSNKPCCSVDSHWEDVTYRLHTMNILLDICGRLEKNIDKVKTSIEGQLSVPEIASLIMRLLEELVQDCRKQFPVLKKTPGINLLDIKKYEARVSEMTSIEKGAVTLRESATDVNEAVNDIERYLQRLQALAVEPQNSMPDVIIWMLSGSKRIAYYRVPANEILFSPENNKCGKNCGKVQNIFMKYPGEKQSDIEDHPEVPCQISVMLWLGLEKHQNAWTNRSDVEGEFGVFAETYENQMKFLGKWTTKGMMRSNWSDAEGTVKLLKENFAAPRGWHWEDDWFVNPEISIMYHSDTGHKTFLDDVYECESRLPGDNWGAAADVWKDIYGNKSDGPIDVECTEGWTWSMEWTVDLNRAVDEHGWEYTVDHGTGSYIAVEKMYHLYRRRRLVRERKLNLTSHMSTEDEEMADLLEEGGWEYATTFNLQFRSKERTADLVRRRRWHRRVIQDDPSAPALFRRSGIGPKSESENGKSYKSEKADSADVPRMIIFFEKHHKFQLRVYLFQARDLLPADADGLSDPYARVSFQNHSQVTRCIHRTLCPSWDETLVFEEIYIYGSTEVVELNSPRVVIELFDKDEVGKDEYMGRCVAQPTVKLNGAAPPTPQLLWHPVQKGKEDAGEILAAFELYLDEGADLPFLPPKSDSYYIVPSGIRPVLQRTAIEVLCWGVRNMKKYQLANITSPNVEFECGGHVIQSDAIKNTQKNPNFEKPSFYFDVMLPKEELYIPPMNVKVRDNRSFGRCPIVGVHCLKSLQPYRYDTPKDDSTHDDEEDSGRGRLDSGYELTIDEDKKKKSDATFDWWSKYYASIGAHEKAEGYLDEGHDTLIVYHTKLESVEHFKQFQDFIVTFPLYRGKVKSGEDLTDVGEFKGTFRVYPLPNDPSCSLPPKMIHSLPPCEPVECVIRIYIIKAIDLQPMDPNGLADPYVVISLGKKKISDQDNYIANTLNPVFGKMFELTAAIPIVKDLNISMFDYDLIGADDEIGTTTIDLENRFLSRFRPTCGLPRSYYTSGVNKWRDSQTPKQILEKYCQVEGCPLPKYKGNTRVIVNGQLYRLEEFEEGTIIHQDMGPADQRLALHVLSCQPLVPEHIETRALYSSLQPDMQQGKIQLWVDIFPKDLGPPGEPFDVSPRIPQKYDLRVIIWNTSDVILEETNVMGEAMSDIFVKGWIAGIDDSQKTDVHFRSLDGTGNFNWRFVFPFLYVPAEKVMVVRKKRHLWSLDMTESRMPPRLIIQIWDNDIFSPDDFLGQLELVLTNMPKPAKHSKKCSLEQVDAERNKKKNSKPRETVSLFEMKRVFGWWPCAALQDGESELTGKVEMTIEVITGDELTEKPAGKGRSDPNLNPTLDPPNRPATSFLWFASPFKSLRYILWRRYKWYVIGFIVVVCLIALLVLFFYSMPGYTVKKIFSV